MHGSVCRKSMFLKQTSNSLPLSPCPLSPGKGDFTGATAPRPCRGLRPCDPIFKNYIVLSTVRAVHQGDARLIFYFFATALLNTPFAFEKIKCRHSKKQARLYAVLKTKRTVKTTILFFHYLSRLYFFLNLSTRPPVSTNFCFPVKKGWHFEQISTFISCLVDLVSITSPQAHLIVVGW